jgi:histidyl-tRNA synthetase
VGFAMGDVVIELVLQEKGVIPQELGETPQVIVTIFDEQTMVESLKIANEIRNYGFTTVLYPDADKLGKQFKFASKAGIPLAVVLGPDEIQNNQVAVKNLLTREQVIVDRGKLLSQIRDFLP